MSATRSFHLTAADAIRDALDDLETLPDIRDEDVTLDSALAPIRAALTEALELLGERP